MSYSSEVLTDSPLGYYRLGEASGTTLVDSSGNGRNGTWEGTTPTFGAAGLLAGDSDTCVYFSGNDRASVASAAWMNVAQPTVTALIKPDTTSGSRTIAGHDEVGGTGEVAFRIRQNGTGLDFFIRNSSGTLFITSAASVLALGVTHWVAGVVRASTIELWVDGAMVSSASYTGTLLMPSTPFRIGGLGGGAEPFLGWLDEVAFFGTALSSARLGAHYTAATTVGGGATQTVSLAGVLPDITESLTIASYTDTITANDWQGRVRDGSFIDETEEPVVPVPASVTLAAKVDKALAYPTPTLIDGRPT